jgi:hypothetical protein
LELTDKHPRTNGSIAIRQAVRIARQQVFELRVAWASVVWWAWDAKWVAYVIRSFLSWYSEQILGPIWTNPPTPASPSPDRGVTCR